MSKKKGVLLVISGPTCSGKDAVMRELIKRNKKMQRVVTTNSREMRPDEIDGVDYHFVSRQDFERLIAEEAFFEWVEYRGEYRGGQIKHVKEALDSGSDVVWRIDVRGVKNIYEKVKEMVPRSVFVMLSSSMEILKRRSELRKTEEPEWENWSMNRAKWELNQESDFDEVVINKEGKLKETVEEVEEIVERVRSL